MSMREQDRPHQTTSTMTPTDVHQTDGHRAVWRAGETKGSVKTTEFWAAVMGVAALIIIYNASSDPSLDLFRTCLLCALLGAAYIVSRGFAKSGSRPEKSEWDRTTRY